MNMLRVITKKKRFFLCLVVLFFIFISFTLAKYIQKKDQDTLYEASAFYFESDYLNDLSNVKSYTLESGIDDIAFEIHNNVDELRYSDVKINYQVTLTDIDGNSVKDKDNQSISMITSTLDKGSIHKNDHKFSNLKDGIYVVTATSIKPYSKTIKANFIITNSITEINYNVTDATNSPILQLMIDTKDYNGNVKIEWPNGVTPDNTNPIFADVTSGYTKANKVIAVQKNSEYIFQFFKENPNLVFSNDDFKVGGDL